MIFRFKHHGKIYTFDDERMSIPEAQWIKRETGIVGMELFQGFRKLDVDCLLVVFAIALKRGGIQIDTIADVPLDEGNGYYQLLTSIQEDNDQAVRPTSRTTKARKPAVKR